MFYARIDEYVSRSSAASKQRTNRLSCWTSLQNRLCKSWNLQWKCRKFILMFCKFLFGMDTKKVWIISFWYGHCCGRAFGGTDLELYWEGKNYGSVSRIWYLLLSQEELWQRYEELISVTVPEILTYILTIVLLWYLSPSFDTNCRVFPGCRSFCMHSVPYRAIWLIWYDPRRHLCCHMASLNCHVCGTP